MKNIILIGAGGHAKSCIDVIESTQKYNIIGLIDIKEKIGERIFGYEVIDTDENLKNYISDENEFIISIGQIKTADKRKNLFEKIKNLGGNFATICSPNAYISKYAEIGEGTIVMHRAIINADAKIGKNCIINTNALIEHEVNIGNHCHIATSAVINGNVNIGDESFVGSNATIVQGKVLPQNVFIKALSLNY